MPYGRSKRYGYGALGFQNERIRRNIGRCQVQMPRMPAYRVCIDEDRSEEEREVLREGDLSMPIVSLSLSEVAYTIYRELPRYQRSRIISMWIQNIASSKEKVADLTLSYEMRGRKIARLEQQLDRYKTRMLELDREFVTGQK